ncbi:ankyrin repeat domain-containing protein [Rhodopirellula baltica]|uniref:Ankyrin repeat protein n=1 Tax=Rhodopirellula baltica SWK14 TaxID=993516 RepID=L7CLR7_RHOBT|nr:ankyrin repeat domain-containing protein [Rhodopirellula baltica]ELP34552.1 ankyrin repeat protein [Rhodopirellula baltica SWK14]
MNRADFQLIDAIRSGCLADFNAAVDAGAYHSARDWNGNPALVVAYKTQRPDYARRLIALGADPHHIRDRRGDTLLIRSARTGDIGLLTVLLADAVDPSVAGQRDRTALHHAAKHGFDFVARSLIDHGANLDAGDNHRHAPLHLAARHGRTGVVRELLRAGATTNAQNHTSYTPAHEAAASGHADIAKQILGKERPHRRTHDFIRLVEQISHVAERHDHPEASKAIHAFAFEP